MSTDKILTEVAAERIRQDKKWGEQNHSPSVWSMILGEEVGEVHRAALEAWASKDSLGRQRWNDQWLAQYRSELVQVAAVAVSMIECLDRKKWKENLL